VESFTIPELESLTIYLHELEEPFISRRAHVILSISDDVGVCDREPSKLLGQEDEAVQSVT
jgi:hypothetical protein